MRDALFDSGGTREIDVMEKGHQALSVCGLAHLAVLDLRGSETPFVDAFL